MKETTLEKAFVVSDTDGKFHLLLLKLIEENQPKRKNQTDFARKVTINVFT